MSSKDPSNSVEGAELSLQSRRLTESHKRVLFLLSKGLRNAEIADQVGVSERTVKGYVSQLLLIFDVTNRTELVGLFATDSFGTGTSAGAKSGHP